MYYSSLQTWDLQNVTQFEQDNGGIVVRAGHPLFYNYFQNNTFYGFMSYKIDESEVNFGPTRDVSDVLDPSTVNGTTSSVSVSFEFDKRNDRMMPTDGSYASASYEYAGVGGDIKYMKATGSARYYKNIFWDVVFRNNLSYGILSEIDGDPIPFTQLFRLGGPNNLRGYQFRNVGTRRFSDKLYQYLIGQGVSATNAVQQANTVVGGKQQAYFMTELEFPLAKEAGMRAVIFYDTGMAEDDLVASRLRSDVGFGIRWFSPMGPLRFEFGFPLDRQAEFGERSNNFQFAVGSPF